MYLIYMNRELPIYKFVMSEEEENDGVPFIAMVSEPAIMKRAFMFDNVQKFSADKERRIITTPAMIADLPIYRRDKEHGEFYAVFEKSEIEKIQNKFMKKGFLHNVNEMHDPSKVVDGVYMINSFLSDNQMGIKAPKGFEDLPEGTWFVSYKIDNTSVWDKFSKTGEFTGVSVEFNGGMVLEKDMMEKEINKLIKEILS